MSSPNNNISQNETKALNTQCNPRTNRNSLPIQQTQISIQSPYNRHQLFSSRNLTHTRAPEKKLPSVPSSYFSYHTVTIYPKSPIAEKNTRGREREGHAHTDNNLTSGRQNAKGARSTRSARITAINAVSLVCPGQANPFAPGRGKPLLLLGACGAR